VNYKYLVYLLIVILIGCTRQPEIIPEDIVDISYDELKAKYSSCVGRGVMSARGKLPWKLNYIFFTQNDSSFIQFRDIFGRRLLFVEALPSDINLWDMQKNRQYNSTNSSSIPIFDILESYDIAQILWGEIPYRFNEMEGESGFEKDSNLVNFELSPTKLGMVLDKVTFNIDSLGTVIEFKIFERDFDQSNATLLKGIPENIPYN